MWGPFYKELRQEQHLCYGLNIVLGGLGNQATLGLSVDTSPDLIRKVPDAYRKVLETIADKGLTDHQISLIRSKILSTALFTSSILDDPITAIAACEMVDKIEIFRQASQVDNKALKAVAAYILDQPQLVSYTFPKK